MVMATEVLDAGHERPATMEAAMLHERLVAHVRAVSGEEDPRASVWGEHSYARPRGPPPGALVRVLLEPRAHAERVDVLALPVRAPAPPADRCSDHDDDDDDDEEEEDSAWEERLAAQAPGPAHARLARSAVAALRALRLERAAGGRALGRWQRREGARAAARRLRRALAPHWGGAATWLLNALPARLPADLRRLLPEALGELRRAAPHLAERLPPQPSPPADPLDAVGVPREASAPGPWLALAPSGCDALDERFARRLRALLHMRRLVPARAREPAAPDRWCAALAHEARAALGAVLEEAGARPVVLCGAGAGAALATWLAAGGAAGVRALLLLAPPLLTAEGARDRPEDILEEVAVPLLAVVGGAGAQCWRGAAAEVAARGGAGGARRVLLLAGADDALRVPRRLRRRLALPQQALDAAVAEECARWASDAADPAAPAAPAARAARRGVASGVASGATSGAEPDERNATLGGSRAIEIVDGRVVSRATGGSPLALPAPRRLEPRAEPRAEPALAAADIMQLPIVFADDEPALDAVRDAAGALTVTSGNPRRAPPAAPVTLTRVLVAKRAPPAPAPAPRGRGRPPNPRPALPKRRALL